MRIDKHINKYLISDGNYMSAYSSQATWSQPNIAKGKKGIGLDAYINKGLSKMETLFTDKEGKTFYERKIKSNYKTLSADVYDYIEQLRTLGDKKKDTNITKEAEKYIGFNFRIVDDYKQFYKTVLENGLKRATNLYKGAIRPYYKYLFTKRVKELKTDPSIFLKMLDELFSAKMPLWKE